MQPLDLDPELGAQLGVEVRQRLVEQEHVDVAHQRPADRHALALAAGERRRACGRGRLDLQDPGGRLMRLSISARGRPAFFSPNDRLPRTVICG